MGPALEARGEGAVSFENEARSRVWVFAARPVRIDLSAKNGEDPRTYIRVLNPVAHLGRRGWEVGAADNKGSELKIEMSEDFKLGRSGAGAYVRGEGAVSFGTEAPSTYVTCLISYP